MIKIGFSTHKNSFVSWLIRKITKSKASHSWILLDEEYFGTPIVMEAVGVEGFRMISLEVFKKQGNIIIDIVEPKISLEPGVTRAIHWLGEPYDREAFFGAFFVMVGRWLRVNWKNPFRSSRTQFCSEAVVRILQASNYPGTEWMDPESTTPQDLIEFFKSELKFN